MLKHYVSDHKGFFIVGGGGAGAWLIVPRCSFGSQIWAKGGLWCWSKLNAKLSYVICDGSWNWMPARSSSMVSIQSKLFDMNKWGFHSSNSSSKITPKTRYYSRILLTAIVKPPNPQVFPFCFFSKPTHFSYTIKTHIFPNIFQPFPAQILTVAHPKTK